MSDNIYEIVEKLKSRGVKVSEVSDIGFGLLVFFKDPEDNEYEYYNLGETKTWGSQYYVLLLLFNIKEILIVNSDDVFGLVALNYF